MNRIATAFAVFGVLVLAGCQSGGFSGRKSDGGASGSSSPGLTGKVLHYAIETNPTTLDPGIVQDGDTLDLLQNVYEGLVGWGEDNQPVGLLAEKWEVKDGGKTYVFTLRKGVKFHNGKTMTADDVKWSIERACDPDLHSVTADAYMSDIEGVTDRVNKKATEVSGVKVIDPGTVQITLKKPVPYFLGKLTYLVSAVVPKGDLPMKELTDFHSAIGTGPFKISNYVPNQVTQLTAFADYWGGKPALDGIERPVVSDGSTRLNKYRNGELDLLKLQRQDVEAVKKDKTLSEQLVPHDRPSTWYIAMNQLQYEPFKKREVRQAFAMAIDKDKIINELFDGLNTKATAIVPPGIKGGNRPEAKGLPYDPAGAKKLLASAGYSDPSKMPKLTLTFREGYPDAKLVAEAVATMINQNLGVAVSPQPMEWRAYLDKYDRGEQVFYHMRWAADYLDPENFLSHMLTTTGPENKFGYSNKEYDELCAKADTLTTWEERLPLYAKAEDLVLQDAPWVPIYYQKDYELMKPTVSGIRESLFGHLPHTKTTVKAP